MKLAYQSIYQNVIKENKIPEVDDYFLKDNQFVLPCDDFVLCRRLDGSPAAVFGEMAWDFNTYNMSAEYISIINFDFFKNFSPLCKDEKFLLIGEIKKLLFLLIYLLPDMGRTGSLSIKVLLKRFHILKDLAIFCESIKQRYILERVSLSSILSIDVYFAEFIKTISENKRSELSDLLINLNRLKKEYIGFELTPFYQARSTVMQTPIIPSRIYFLTFSKLTDEIETLWQVKDNLTSLIQEFTSKPIGRSIETNRTKHDIKNKRYPELDELLTKHDLKRFFVDSYSIKDKRNLLNKLSNIQLTCKYFIHLYTAMRNGEAFRIKYDCVQHVDIATSELTENSEHAPQRFVNVISSTTKFTGYRKQAGWLSPEPVTKAIEVLQALVKGIAFLLNKDAATLPLFQSLSFILRGVANGGKVTNFSKKTPYSLTDIKILNTDREELIASDTTRNFNEPEFQSGQPWSYSSHQFRRSLAFFGANSNLVSQTTGAILFKHLSFEMQRYYRRGFNQIRSLLGSFNKETGEIEIHKDHFLFEYRSGISIGKAREIIQLLFSDKSLYGKKGSYIDRQREGLNDDDVNIIEIKANTERQAKQGELSYKKTLLGGCMKLERCEDNMLGNFTECIDCDDAVIEPERLDSLISEMDDEITAYDKNTGEYQFTNTELNRLKLFRKKEQKKRNHYV